MMEPTFAHDLAMYLSQNGQLTNAPALQFQIENFMRESQPRRVQRLTAEQINALPEFAREWIHDLETQTDHTGQLAELRLLQDAFKAQELLIAEFRSKLPVSKPVADGGGLQPLEFHGHGFPNCDCDLEGGDPTCIIQPPYVSAYDQRCAQLASSQEALRAAREVLAQAGRALEELYPTEAGGYQHSEEYRAVHGVLGRIRSLLSPEGSSR